MYSRLMRSAVTDTTLWCALPSSTSPFSSLALTLALPLLPLALPRSGDWAGAVRLLFPLRALFYRREPADAVPSRAQVWPEQCLSLGATCSDAVRDPKNFDNAYWEVAYVRVYSI